MYMNFDVHTFKIQIVLKCKFKKIMPVYLNHL